MILCLARFEVSRKGVPYSCEATVGDRNGVH
jgi:hypothetical protein